MKLQSEISLEREWIKCPFHIINNFISALFLYLVLLEEKELSDWKKLLHTFNSYIRSFLKKQGKLNKKINKTFLVSHIHLDLIAYILFSHSCTSFKHKNQDGSTNLTQIERYVIYLAETGLDR